MHMKLCISLYLVFVYLIFSKIIMKFIFWFYILGVLILRRGLQRVLFVSPEWEPDTYSSTHSTMEFDYRVTCIANHYGSGCGNFCRPRDDTFGHYECSESGKRVCLSGWTGEYCTHRKFSLLLFVFSYLFIKY